ncbi:hypothetical protein NDU88_002273 [Pleurodeles waltl]|uniref:Uncharacterized protein n=1 Tax=Pleurodeles waltl TaxID=8319 RepID=A0AAV7WKY1_PLEWA|nr:hypothetical protein NDU88_002273 [Pleurodeles waltl]
MTGARAGTWSRLALRHRFEEKEARVAHRPLFGSPCNISGSDTFLSCDEDQTCTATVREVAVFYHPEEVWGWLEIWDKVGLDPSRRSGVGSAHTSGVDGADWRRHGDDPLRVTAQRRSAELQSNRMAPWR